MNRALHRFAQLTVGCTFLLLMAGALVTGNDAADSVPDWPLAYHRLIPPLVGGIRFEYAHRVVAGIVAVLTLVLAVWIAAADKRRWLRRLGWTALALVIAQALLGAARVLAGHPALTATSHAILAQIFFITVVSLAVSLGPWWNSDWPVYPEPPGLSVRAASLWTTIFIVIQTILGAGFRHGAFGILPHLIGAAVVTAAVVVTGRLVRERFRDVKPLRKAVIWLHSFFGLQILLGILAYWAVDAAAKAPQPVPMLVGIMTAHVLGGALLLAASVVLAIRCYRLVPAHAGLVESSGAKASA